MDCREVIPAIKLRLKIGIGAGEIFIASLGGALDRYEYVAYGLPVVKATIAENASFQGELTVPVELLEYLENKCEYSLR
jgi:class 3 adenylate cyclase